MKLATILPLLALALHAESGADAWLRYAPPSHAPASIPTAVSILGDAEVEQSARAELIRGIRSMLDRIPRAETGLPADSAIVIGTFAEFAKSAPQLLSAQSLPDDSYVLKTSGKYTVVAGPNARGALYGAFALLRKIALSQPIAALNETQTPYAPARWVNEWNNLTGIIERGYGGQSIFWTNGKAREDLTRAGEYARLLASLGINACSITNVNADIRVLTPGFLPDIARVAAAMRPWGVRVAIAVDFGSPKSVGGLDTFDPVDPTVAAWWKSKFDDIYKAIPDFAGVVLKADSEGRVGPSTYGRTHADAANVVARGLAPHGGLLFYRGFVYDHHMDWNNPKNDRARAAWDNFHDLDGKFDDNVIIQIKNGPIDFQVREPHSPLFGALEKTSQAIELQITQEYFGQARFTVFLVPYWKYTLDFDMQAKGPGTPVKALVAGKVFHHPGGFVGVSNVGLDDNWTGNHMSQANLYGFGRLAWNPDLTAQQINDEWTRLTFGDDPKVDETVAHIQLSSWPTYEKYTGPLGLQTLTDMVGNHFGVNVNASEGNGWGQWHRADNQGVGMDRTVATGTGFIGQYRPEVAKVFENLATCPDDLLLFLHHVPYTYKLHNGKTVIQYIYDSHYEGAAEAQQWPLEWKALAGRVDERRYREILAQLEYQAGQAIVWRDAVNGWFHTASGIADAKNRIGREPRRVEAEDMTLDGYTVRDIKPAPLEDASGGKLITCPVAKCTATQKYTGPAGWFDINVEYFDQSSGASTFQVFVGAQLVDEWKADLNQPARMRAMAIDSTSSTRRTIHGVSLRPGDEIRIVGVPDAREPAAVDYIEIVKQ